MKFPIAEPENLFHMTDDRLRHMRGVAEQAYRITYQCGFGEEQARKMFVLGFLHDIGYGIAEPDRHAEAGGEVLEECGYAFSGEIAAHGDPSAELTNPLVILDVADLTVDSHGNPVTISERIADIRERHGWDSEVTRISEQVITRLGREVPTILLLAERIVRETRHRQSLSK